MKLYSETIDVRILSQTITKKDFVSIYSVEQIIGGLLGDIDKLKEELILERSLNEEFFKQLWKHFCDIPDKLARCSIDTITYYINSNFRMQVSKREVRKGIKMALDRGWLKPSEDKYYPNGYVIVGSMREGD